MIALRRLVFPAPEGADTIIKRAGDSVMSGLTTATIPINNRSQLFNRASHYDLCPALRLLDILDLLAHLLYQNLKVDTDSRHSRVG